MVNVNSAVARLAARTLVKKLAVGVPLAPSEMIEAGYCITCLIAYVPYMHAECGPCIVCADIGLQERALPFVDFCHTHMKSVLEASAHTHIGNGACLKCNTEAHTRIAVWGERCYRHLTEERQRVF